MTSPPFRSSGVIDGHVPGRVSVSAAHRELASRLREAGIPTPELDARLLVCAACRVSHERFAAEPGRPIDAGEAERLSAFAKRRLDREPVSRILARRAFWKAEFLLGPTTLDPRPETETLVEAALELLAGLEDRRNGPRILDLGTGTGCVLLSLLSELPHASGVGTDVSFEALEVARRNADRLGVADRAGFVCTSWFDGLAGAFEIVVANPPYVPTAAIGTLAPEVARHDPARALDGGPDGLDAFRAILSGVRARVRPRAWLVLEIGQGQLGGLTALLRSCGLASGAGETRHFADLAGIVRCVAVRVQ